MRKIIKSLAETLRYKTEGAQQLLHLVICLPTPTAHACIHPSPIHDPASNHPHSFHPSIPPLFFYLPPRSSPNPSIYLLIHPPISPPTQPSSFIRIYSVLLTILELAMGENTDTSAQAKGQCLRASWVTKESLRVEVLMILIVSDSLETQTANTETLGVACSAEMSGYDCSFCQCEEEDDLSFLPAALPGSFLLIDDVLHPYSVPSAQVRNCTLFNSLLLHSPLKVCKTWHLVRSAVGWAESVIRAPLEYFFVYITDCSQYP